MATGVTLDLNGSASGVGVSASGTEGNAIRTFASSAIVGGTGSFAGQTLVISGLTSTQYIDFYAADGPPFKWFVMNPDGSADYYAIGYPTRVLLAHQSPIVNDTMTWTWGNVSSSTVQKFINSMSLADSSENPSPAQTLTFDLVGARANVNLSVVPINDAPNGVNTTLQVLEDSARVLTTSSLRSVDVDGNKVVFIRISKIFGGGSLTLDGVQMASGQTISVADITAGKLVFTPELNKFGTNYASIEFQAQDDGGTANGGTDLDKTAATLTINVSSVADAPTGKDAVLTIVEDAARVLIASDFGFSDIEGNSFSGVRVATLPTSGGLALNGNAVVAVSTIPISAINAGQLVFTPSPNVNGIGSASFTFQVQDNGSLANGGSNLDPTPNVISFNISPVNDAPTVVQPLANQTSDEDVLWTYQLPANTFADVDGTTLTLTATLADGTALPAWLQFDAATRTFSGTPPPNFNGKLSFKVTASDGSLSASSSFELTVNPIEDALPAPGLERTDFAGHNGYIAIGDFDADGDSDLASSNWLGNDGAASTISLWRNEGDGVFVKASTHPAPYAQDLQFADVNGDGRLDVVVEQTYSNLIRVFENGGTWSAFAQTYTVPAGNVVVAMEVADVDGDGKGDLISTSYNQGEVSVSLGQGKGGFSKAAIYKVGSISYGLAVADVTGDGVLDIVTANGGSNSVSILAGGSKGAFSPFATLQTGAAPLFVTVADLGNGRNDIIVNNRDSDTITVFLGNGAGSFTATSYAVGDAPFGVTTGDLNGDGKLDVIATNAGAGTISVLLGNGDGTLQSARTFASLAGAFSVVAADLNGDGRDDLAVGSSAGMSLFFSTSFPNGLALDPSTDSGLVGDRRTNFAQVTIRGSIDAGSTVTLYDGTSSIGSGVADADGHFSVTTIGLTDGTHTIHAEATDGLGNLSLPSAPLVLLIDTTGPNAPTGLALDATTDSALLGDNISNIARARINGTAELGSTVALYEGATEIGTGVVDPNGAFSITLNAPLSDGVHNITAVATDSVENNGTFSTPLFLTIDTQAGSAEFVEGDIDQNGTTENVSLGGIVSDATTSVVLVRIYLDGVLLDEMAPVNGTWFISEANIADAIHLLTSETTDAAGNIGPGDRGFIGSSMNDTIVGTDLGEIISGQLGFDRLTGGAGPDTFYFGDPLFAPMPSGLGVETVTDFVPGEDQIHLAGMADFSYRGQSFSVAPHQVAWYQFNGNTYVIGDMSGDSTSDFMVQLLGLHTLTAADFILG